MITKILDNENDIITTHFERITEDGHDKMINNIHCELKKIDTKNIQLSRAVMALYVASASPVDAPLRIKRSDNSSYLIDVFNGNAEDGYLYIDITDELQDALNNGHNYIDVYFDGYVGNIIGEDDYYTFEDLDSKLYLEYSSKNDENENSVFLETPSTLAGSGEVNLATGRLTFGFNDTTVGNSALPIVVSHHYNQNNAGSNEFNCGNGWKLNAQQYLKQNEVNSSFADKVNTAYTWVDAEGKEISFLEKFYYLDNKKEKVYVYASSVQLNADGSYTLTDGTVVTKECVSDGGLILEAEPKYVKNKDLFYTATEEIASLEQRLKSINDAIEQINDNKTTIKKSFINSLNSIVYQIRQNAAGFSAAALCAEINNTPGALSKANILIKNLSEFDSIKFTFDMDYSSIDSVITNLQGNMTTAYNSAKDFNSFARGCDSYSFEPKLQTLKVFYESINSSLSITTEQYNEQLDNLTKQEAEYNNPKLQYEEQLKIYRQNQPTYFIKDGDLVYGFGNTSKEDLMRLILVVDKFENYITYTYDRADKLVQITSSTGDNVMLEYENDLLKTITDSNGKTISYNYNNKNLRSASSDNRYNYFYYNDRYYLIGAINSSDILGVGFEYAEIKDRVTGIHSLQKYKSISTKGVEDLRSSEIANSDAFTLSYSKYKKHNSTSLNYYDYKTVIVTDQTTGKSTTYLFDSSGKLKAQYDGSFDGTTLNENKLAMTYQKNSDKISFEAIEKEFAEELVTNVYTTSGFSPIVNTNNRFQSTGKFPDPNKTIIHTLSAEAIEKIKTENMDCLILSGWAKADSTWIKTYNDAFYSKDEQPDKWEKLIFSNNDGRKFRKFEIRVEIATTDNSTYKYFVSFDWMNDNWQYCALPIKLPKDIRDNIKEIKLIFDYSKNYGEAQFFGMSLKEGDWSKKIYNNEGRVTFSGSSHTVFNTDYSYNDDKLSRIQKYATLPDEENDTDFVTSYYYNGQGALVKTVDEGNTSKDGDQIVTEYVYDDKGNVVKEMVYNEDEPANKFITEHIINEDGSSTQSVDALGNKTFSSYDKHGNLSEQTDALGNKIAFGYEKNFGGLANITASVNGETSSNENVYECGLLVKTKHNGCEYEFDYDGLGRKTAVRINGEPYCTIDYEGNDTQTITYANDDRIQKTLLKDGNRVKVYFAPVGEKITDHILVQYDKTAVDDEKESYSYKEYIEDRTNDGEDVKYKTYYDKKGRVAKTEIKGGDYVDKLLIDNTYGFNDALTGQRIQLGNNDPIDEIERTYEYGYTNKLKSIKHVEEIDKGQVTVFTELPTLDKLGRVSSVDKAKIFKNENAEDCLERKLSKQYNYLQNGERATTLVASETFGENNLATDKLSYTYDKKGNISEIRENGELVARYEYDSLNRLVREDNRPLNKSFFMTYDTAGNIVEKKESAFTLGLFDTIEKTVVGSYVYADKGNKDQLLSFNGESIEYDVLGNPTIYRNKKLSWSHINRLAGVGENIGYKYNYAGIRLFKTVDDKTTKYYCDGAKIIAQDDGTDLLYFYYGTEGVTAFKHKCKNGTKVYHYKKDMLGNILGIYDANDQLLVKYVYDAWGNHKTFVLENNLWVDISSRTAYTESDCTATKIAILNPFRYRSYYFDIETGLYYLQSRYYDPQTGRFISMDDISYLDPQSIHGLNLYAYCANNPVMCIDPSGQSFLVFLVAAAIGFGVSFTSSVVSQAIFDGQVNIVTALIDGAFGAISSALFMIPGMNAVVCGLVNAGLTALNGIITTGIDNNWEFTWADWATIGVSALLSGVISGFARRDFIKNGGEELLRKTHKTVGTIWDRLGNGYYNKKNFSQRSITSAKEHIRRLLYNVNFSKGYQLDWLATLLSSAFSTSLSKGLNRLLL